MRICVSKFGLVACLCSILISGQPAWAGEVLDAPPSSPDPAKTYLFYMHGGYVEKHGANGDYRYGDVLEALAGKGLVVIGEARSSGNPGRYARTIVEQVQGLLDAGVPATNITVAGHSKGGFISLLASTRIGNSAIKYGIMAACGQQGTPFHKTYRRFIKKDAKRAKGKFLVAWEEGDNVAGNCDQALDKAGADYRNEVLSVGGGHRLFYQPEATWIELLTSFALSK